MLTTVLAVYAAVVSTSSVLISYIAYRSADPRLSGGATLYDRETLLVWFYNNGRGAITISRFVLMGVRSRSRRKKSVEYANFKFLWPLYYQFTGDQCGLPKRIEGHSDANWEVKLSESISEWLDLPTLVRLDLMIDLGNGKSLKFKIDVPPVSTSVIGT
jgi:hypothetical protein